MKKTHFSFLVLLLLSAIIALAEEQRMPLGQLSFNGSNGNGGSTHDLSKSTRTSDDGLIKYQGRIVRKIEPFGSMSWQYFPNTEYFDGIIVIEVTTSDGQTFLRAIKNGDFQAVYKDEAIKITYHKNE